MKNNEITNSNLVTPDMIATGKLNLNSNFIISPNGPRILKSVGFDKSVIDGFAVKLVKPNISNKTAFSSLVTNPAALLGRLDLSNVTFDSGTPVMSKPGNAWNLRANGEPALYPAISSQCNREHRAVHAPGALVPSTTAVGESYKFADTDHDYRALQLQPGENDESFTREQHEYLMNNIKKIKTAVIESETLDKANNL